MQNGNKYFIDVQRDIFFIADSTFSCIVNMVESWPCSPKFNPFNFVKIFSNRRDSLFVSVKILRRVFYCLNYLNLELIY